MDMEHADFGQGRPHVCGAQLMPLQHRGVVMMTGPGGDGVVCFTGFPSSMLEKLDRANILQQILPEARLISPATVT